MAATYVTALLEAQSHHCCYCHHTMPESKKLQTKRNRATKEHVEPRCHGGQTVADNLVMACAQCNHIRGAMDAEVFYDLIWYWFRRDPTLHARWHTISKSEFVRLARECKRIHHVQWQRRLKRCEAAAMLHRLVPLPFLDNKVRV
jgi:hypothetical protein